MTIKGDYEIMTQKLAVFIGILMGIGLVVTVILHFVL